MNALLAIENNDAGPAAVENPELEESLDEMSFRSFCRKALACQYACSFGVELTMSQAAVLYLKDRFGLSTQSAMAISSLMGWM